MSQMIINQTKEKMQKVVDSFINEIVKIRAGRANPNMLNGIMVEYYGSMTPLNQVSNIVVPEARQLLIKPYEKSLIPAICGAINKSELGLNPQSEADVIRINIPMLTEERRKMLVKDLWKHAETFKVAIRNDRRDANDHIKKDKSLTDDDRKFYESEIQKITDEFIKKIDAIGEEKEKELMEV